jgi:hypothetical protein
MWNARVGNGPCRTLRSYQFSENRIRRSIPSSFMTADGPVRWKTVCTAAIVAGVVSTVFQFLLWWLAGHDPVALLLRDSRLAAAILMGPSVLPPPATFDPVVMLAATLVHFALSVAYAAVSGWTLSRTGLSGMAARMAGAVYGAAIFALNMYGFTWVFPWFMQTRDVITLAAHVVFGMSLAQAQLWSMYDGGHAGPALRDNKGEHR